MTAVVLRRILLAPLLLIVVSFSIFVLVSFIPGNPATILAGTNPQLVPYIESELHLSQPLPLRYLHWLGGAIQGNLGISWVGLAAGRHETVSGLILQRFPITAAIAGLAIVLSMIIGLLLGMLSAVKVGGRVDRAVTALAALLIAMPGFWLAFVMILWFGVELHWLPVLGYVPFSAGLWPWLSHIILPGVALAMAPAAALSLQFRGALVDVFAKDYILSARAKGLRSRTVLWKHALKNAFAPVVTLLGFQLANLIGATVIVENVFDIPGLGTLAIQSTFGRDIPVILGLLVFTTLLVVVVNSLMDVVYAYLNPRVRTGRA